MHYAEFILRDLPGDYSILYRQPCSNLVFARFRGNAEERDPWVTRTGMAGEGDEVCTLHECMLKTTIGASIEGSWEERRRGRCGGSDKQWERKRQKRKGQRHNHVGRRGLLPSFFPGWFTPCHGAPVFQGWSSPVTETGL